MNETQICKECDGSGSTGIIENCLDGFCTEVICMECNGTGTSKISGIAASNPEELVNSVHVDNMFNELKKYDPAEWRTGDGMTQEDDGAYYSVEDVEKLLKQLFSTSK